MLGAYQTLFFLKSAFNIDAVYIYCQQKILDKFYIKKYL